jgi:hypothetical protein
MTKGTNAARQFIGLQAEVQARDYPQFENEVTKRGAQENGVSLSSRNSLMDPVATP